ncbi:MAG: TlpA family protein disulfide reductase [Tannerella sp.]|jgi:thiol-disulfide isomerase/thioredoxin|nr:TlpA family protein disulfide reductase [Tannerella sp.]
MRNLFLLIGLFAAVAVSAKDRVIVNPAYEFTTSGIYNISRVESGKAELRLHIRVESIPRKVNDWIKSELAKAKRKTLMNVEAGEFFEKDTARLIGYIKGYDPLAGFSTGLISAGNELTMEDSPAVIQIHEDGRFEGTIPMNYPVYLEVWFNKLSVSCYLEPGQTLSMILDWEEFLAAARRSDILHKCTDIKFEGVGAAINKELTSFNAKLPKMPYEQAYAEHDKKTPAEFKVFYGELLADYTGTYKRLLDTEALSERTKVILQNSYKIMYATYLFEYESNYGYTHKDAKLPPEFYDFLQDIPMNEKRLISTPNFGTFINRLEFASPFNKASFNNYRHDMQPDMDFLGYLYYDLKMPKTPEDSLYLEAMASMNVKLTLPDVTEEERKKLTGDFMNTFKQHAKYLADYQKKHIDVIKRPSESNLMRWEAMDSIYRFELKLSPGILYDVIKVREMELMFGRFMNDDKNDAQFFLSQQKSHIQDDFLKAEAERIFQKNFPPEKPVAYELPDTKEAKIFKELIAPFKGKILFVDFWATTCGPCIYNIKNNKEQREKYRDSKDVDFIFVTADDESPLDNYNKFVAEQELVNTYRLNADDFRYLRQLFKFIGIPRYIFIDREGKVLNDNANSYQFEYDLKKILENER